MTDSSHKDGSPWSPRAWGTDIHVGLAALTRLPVPAPDAAAVLNPRARRAYPVVGALVGLAAGGVYFAGNDVGLPATVNAVLAVAALTLIGGHLERGDANATVPFMVALLMKIAALAMIGATDAGSGGPHMVVLTLVATGALSQAATLLIEVPAPGETGDAPPDSAGSGAVIAGGSIALFLAFLLLGIWLGLVAIGGALLGAWIGPKSIEREISDGQVSLPVALQQSAKVWSLLAVAIAMRI